MARLLGVNRARLDEALQYLLDVGFLAHRPWRPGAIDGVWQLLPTPKRPAQRRNSSTTSAAELLRQLGFRS
ncbi:MAG: hypothetical protein AAF628_27770 [Planctomycetota bacterium]